MNSGAIIVPQPQLLVFDIIENRKITNVRGCNVYRNCWIHDDEISQKCLGDINFVNCVVDFLDTGEMRPRPVVFPVHTDGRLIGMRTRNSTYMSPTWVYEVGLFSTSNHIECHPGLYVRPWGTGAGKHWIKVLFDLGDLHSVGNSHRVRKFEVVE